MAKQMSSRSATTVGRQGWENSDFPILCQTCLGDNPYMRMTKERFGKECKICARPFTVFRWVPGKGMRLKKTEICQTCAKLKNVCQTCILDLEYGLPVQVRDKALGIEGTVPKSEVNREYFTQNIERQLQLQGESAGHGVDAIGYYGAAATGGNMGVLATAGGAGGGGAGGGGGKAPVAGRAVLEKLQRREPFYKRNAAKICSFFVKGECNRGELCPYRHEMPPTMPDDPLAKQNIKDRFYGTNDPVAEKMLKRAQQVAPKVEPPKDRSITTLFISGVKADVLTESDLRDHFYQFGEIRSVTVVARQSCAFLQYGSRTAAEQAMETSSIGLSIKGCPLRVMWGRAKAEPSTDTQGGAGAPPPSAMRPVPGLPPPALATLPPPPSTSQPVYYPSQDPHRMGTAAATTASASAPTSGSSKRKT